MHQIPTDPLQTQSPIAEFRRVMPGRSRPAAESHEAMDLLHTAESDRRREARRVTTALLVLLVLGFVVLNVVLYQGARARMVSERWDQLAANTEEKRRALRRMLLDLRHQAMFVAQESEVRSVLGAGPPAPHATERAISRELSEAATSFRLLAIELTSAAGVSITSSDRSTVWNAAATRALARSVVASGQAAFLPVVLEHHGHAVVVLAAPVESAGRGRIGAVLLFAGLDERARPSLLDGPLTSPGSGAYLVLREGHDAVVATRPPASSGLVWGQRLRLDDPLSRPAAIAAQQLETRIEVERRGHAPLWAATLAVPELNGGLVGQADRGALLMGMRATLLGLGMLDLGVIGLALIVVWLWRRHYAAQLAEREADLQKGHAARLQAVLDSAFDAILSLDGEGRVLTANRAAERLFRRSASELQGMGVDALLRRAGQATGSGAPLMGPWEIWRSQALRPDGSEVAVEYSLASSARGDGAFFTLVARDIAARVEAERQIQAFATGLEVSNRRLEEVNNQLAQASRLKSEFLANTSHELRTPLNGIMGFLQLVLDDLCDSRDEERDFLNQALQCSRHLLGLINDVLDIAKIEAGRLALQIEPIDVAGVFAEVQTVTHVQAEQKGLRLVFDPGEGLPRVRGDFGKLKQILINLVGNSLKFTEKGSIVVRVTSLADAGHCLFEVVDTGIGIPADRQSQIFEKFVQADGSTTRRYGGTGLGLAITRSLVELMGGIIGVESPGPGHGTRMYFSLPVWRGEETLATPTDSGETLLPNVITGPAGGPLVLVVDDDAVFRTLVTTMLHQHGYRTAEAAHAEAGWVLVRRLRPALVLLDYALACADGASLRTGWDLAERMQQDNRSRHIPFLFVTGFDEQLQRKLKGALTFAREPRHVTKPVDAPTLLSLVQDTLGELPNRVVRVLLADDDPMVAAYVTKLLPSNRFQIDVVNNGEECLHALRSQPKGFDLLLLDLMMPDVSGYDVLREMALTGAGARLPVIVLTNEPQPRNELERRLLEQGSVLDVLPKSNVHETPDLLPRLIDAHLASAEPDSSMAEGPPLEVERFRAELPEGDAPPGAGPLGVERFSSERPPKRTPLPVTGTRVDDDLDSRRAA